MDEQIKELVATAKKIQDAAADAKCSAHIDACLIAAGNLLAARPAAKK